MFKKKYDPQSGPIGVLSLIEDNRRGCIPRRLRNKLSREDYIYDNGYIRHKDSTPTNLHNSTTTITSGYSAPDRNTEIPMKESRTPTVSTISTTTRKLVIDGIECEVTEKQHSEIIEIPETVLIRMSNIFRDQRKFFRQDKTVTCNMPFFFSDTDDEIKVGSNAIDKQSLIGTHTYRGTIVNITPNVIGLELVDGYKYYILNTEEVLDLLIIKGH